MSDKILDKIINTKKKVTIFYANWCPYCKRAIDFLQKHKISFKGYNIEKIGIDNLYNTLIKNQKNIKFNPKHKTIPIIFYEKKFIGGLDDFIKFYGHPE